MASRLGPTTRRRRYQAMLDADGERCCRNRSCIPRGWRCSTATRVGRRDRIERGIEVLSPGYGRPGPVGRIGGVRRRALGRVPGRRVRGPHGSRGSGPIAGAAPGSRSESSSTAPSRAAQARRQPPKTLGVSQSRGAARLMAGAIGAVGRRGASVRRAVRARDEVLRTIARPRRCAVRAARRGSR